MVGGKETMNYWDMESPALRASSKGRPGSRSTQRTGLLSGVPDRPGKVAVVVTATIDREVRNLDARALSWGLEKVLSTGTQRVARPRRFTIEVAP